MLKKDACQIVKLGTKLNSLYMAVDVTVWTSFAQWK